MKKRDLTIGCALFFLVGIGIGGFFTERRSVQPYPYNHRVHTAKADCTLCHRGARTGVHAGIPSLEVCTGCHATAPGKNPTPAQVALWEAARRGEAPPWNRIYKVPAHVYFSHRRHVMLGQIECVTCHGEMGEREHPPEFPLKRLKMRDCISCHEKERVTADCTACHR
ncbi:MAG: hypothetical protein D6795_12600 [Deltaproteobacteria bacterium]|nr:MAG: hypothetical protein D6795_12600 [Deltaproteobacteria bacterium]